MTYESDKPSLEPDFPSGDVEDYICSLEEGLRECQKDIEIERLKKENLNVDYLREKTEREHLAKVLYKIENIEADTEQLRKIAGEAIKIELTEGKD